MCKENQGISLLLPMGKQVYIPLQQTRTPLHDGDGDLEDKCHHSKGPSLPLSASTSYT